MRFLILTLFLLLNASALAAGDSPASSKEVRAVWVATTSGLDWPKTLDAREQQSSLLDIVHSVRNAHLNTIFFQARARGDAYYQSSIEPWAQNLTGTLGKDPGWDPLGLLITTAHRTGIEVHAWFNLYKIRGLTDIQPSVPQHVALAHPEWAVEYDGELWLDPGLPEVREYLVHVALDLVRRYDLDGIMFDFIRYPGRDFHDDATYRRYGGGMTRDDWRRNNIDRFVTEFYDSARTVKPLMKVGSTPVGNTSARPYEDPNGVVNVYYQDAQGWLRRGSHDYLAPQIYWDIGASDGDPDFTTLTRQWQSGSYGRHIYTGIAAYKTSVFREIPVEIDIARSSGTMGQAFFRFENILGQRVFGDRYQKPADVPPMSWKDSIPPLPPRHLVVSELQPNVFFLEWLSSRPARDGDTARWYNVYRSSGHSIDTGSDLVAISPSTFFIDTVDVPGSIAYTYAVAALDRANNESLSSPVAGAVVREALDIRQRLAHVTTLSVSLPRNPYVPALIAYRLAGYRKVQLDVLPDSAASLPIATLYRGFRNAGTYIVGLGRYDIPPGMYRIRLQTGDASIEQRLDLRR